MLWSQSQLAERLDELESVVFGAPLESSAVVSQPADISVSFISGDFAGVIQIFSRYTCNIKKARIDKLSGEVRQLEGPEFQQFNVRGRHFS